MLPPEGGRFAVGLVKRPRTCLRPILMGVTHAVNSNRAASRHTKNSAYRCFLPDLTGFTGFRCARPGSHCHLRTADPTKIRPLTGIQPCCSGLQVQGTAGSPSSTAKLYSTIAYIL